MEMGEKFQKGTFHADMPIPNPPSSLLTALNFIVFCSWTFYKTLDITTLYVVHFDYEDLDSWPLPDLQGTENLYSLSPIRANSQKMKSLL